MHDALHVALVLLASAVVVVALFRQLSMPAILGYLVVGVLVGPHAAGLVPASAEQSYLAEFGVVFLMFFAGLDFSLPQLAAMRRTVFGFGAAQVAVVMAAGIGGALLAGHTWREGIVVGGAIAMSSTVIVSRMLAERGQLHTDHGRQVVGVLLFQDLAVIPLLVLVPALEAGDAHVAGAIGLAMAKAGAVLAVVLFVGQRVMRPLFQLVARQKSQELFVLFVLLATLALAWVTGMAGLSLALGAFLAGMLISGTEYRYQVEDYLMPFRDVLLGLFFVAIGMLLDLQVLVAHLAWVLALFAAIFALKLFAIHGLARAFGNPKPTALRAALALAPAGEFGIVLLALALREGSLGGASLQVVLAACLLSMLAAPVILGRMESIVLHFIQSEWTRRAMELHRLAVKSIATRGHVVVCGYGRSGQALAKAIEREGVPFVALDADPERVRQAAAAGDSVVFGDAARREVLVAAGLARATAVVVSFADTHKALAIMGHVRELRPELPVIVRTRDETDVAKLRAAGAAEIVAEEVEGSIMLATQTLMQLGVPLDQVMRQLREARQGRYQSMRGFFAGATDVPSTGGDTPRLRTLVVGEDAACVGRTLGSLNLEGMEVEVTAVRRSRGREARLEPGLAIEAGDILVLLGTPEHLAQAEIRLLQG